jgi:hypothetical protein
MKKNQFTGALIPALLLGSPAMVAASLSSSRVRAKKAVSSFVKCDQKEYKHAQRSNNPFGTFGKAKTAAIPAQKDQINVLSFLKEEGLLQENRTNQNVVSGNTKFRKEFASSCYYNNQCYPTWTVDICSAPAVWHADSDNCGANNDPVIDGTIGGTENKFNEGGGAVDLVTSGESITDSDGGDFDGGLIEVTLDVYQPGDTLTYSGSLPTGATVHATNNGIGKKLWINFDSNIDPSDAQTLLGQLQFNNTDSSDPTVGDTDTVRAVTITVADGDGGSDSISGNLTVVNVKEATTTDAGFDTTNRTNLDPAIKFGDDDETLTIANSAHLSGSTLNGGGGTDTLVTVDGADLTGAASVAAFETITIPASATVTMDETDHDLFSTFTNNASQTITIKTSDGDNALSGNSNIEAYNLNDDITFTLGSATQNASATEAGDTVTFNIGTLTYTGTLSGEGTNDETVQMGDGSSISGATLSNVDILTVDSGASVTVREDQHDAFVAINGTGTNQITISDASNGLTANSVIETYVLGAANTITVTTGATGQNITGSSGNDTVILGSASYTGTINAGGGAGDTLQLANGADISGATVSGFENLILASGAAVTMHPSQLSQFSGTITAAGSETINITGDGDFSTFSNIETFSIGDDSSNTRTVTISVASTDVSATSATDAVTFNIGTLTYTGTITGEGTANDILQMGTGADITGATLNNIEDLTLASGAAVSMLASQVVGFSGTITAAGSETVNITGDGDFTTLNAIESFSVGDDSTNTRTITLGSASTNVTASSASDAVTFDIGTNNYTGTLIGQGDVNDMLQIGNGASTQSATLTDIEDLTIASGASITLTPTHLNNFSGTITAAGTESIALTATGTLTGGNLSAVETLSTISGGSEAITLSAADADGKTLTAVDSSDDSFTVTASAGVQTINGSAGNDTLSGGAGADIIKPGAGTDSMSGGDDADTFSGSASDLNGDTITDLAVGDKILLTGVTGLSTSNVRFNGNSTFEIDTDATTFASPEVSMTLSNNAGGDLDFDSVADSGSDTLITIKAANAAPVITLPSAPEVKEDDGSVDIADDVQIADNEGEDQNVTLTAGGGTLSVTNTGNLTFTAGDGTDDSTMTFSGTLAHVNTALDGMTFKPTADVAGNSAGSIRIQTEDTNGGSDDETLQFNILNAPEVSSINRLTPSSQYTNVDSLIFRVTFSESVSGITSDDFSVNGSSASVSDVSAASGTTTDITVSGGNLADLDGTVRLDISDDNTIVNGDSVGLGGQGTDNYTSGQSYSVDNTAPTTTISSIDISDDTGTSDSDFKTKTASQTISATLSTGLVGGEILYGSVNNGSNWTDITAKVSDTAISWDGATLSGSSSIVLKVSDAAGNDGTEASQAYVLDTTAPTTTISSIDISDDTGSSDSDFVTKTADQNITADLSQSLSAGDILYGSLDNGGSWTNINDKISGGTSISWDSVTLNGGVDGSNTIVFKVTDDAGNDGTFANQNYTLDTTRYTAYTVNILNDFVINENNQTDFTFQFSQADT